MGNDFSSRFQILQDQSLNTEEWKMKKETTQSKILYHIRRPQVQIEEYPIVLIDINQARHYYDVFKIRKDHRYFVSSLGISARSRQDLCASSIQGSLYLERIVKKLSQLNCKFTLPDALHFYYQVLEGYRLLSTDRIINCAYFNVTQNMIGINKNGVIKVWINSYFQRSSPQHSQQNHYLNNFPQSRMVRQILDILYRYSDFSQIQDQPLRSMLSQTFVLTLKCSFLQALTSIKQIAKKFNQGVIPKSISGYYFQDELSSKTTFQSPLSILRSRLISQTQLQASAQVTIQDQHALKSARTMRRKNEGSPKRQFTPKARIHVLSGNPFAGNQSTPKKINQNLTLHKKKRSESVVNSNEGSRVVFINHPNVPPHLTHQALQRHFHTPKAYQHNRSPLQSQSEQKFSFQYSQFSFMKRQQSKHEKNLQNKAKQDDRKMQNTANSTNPVLFTLNDSFNLKVPPFSKYQNDTIQADFTFEQKQFQELDKSTKEFYQKLLSGVDKTVETDNQMMNPPRSLPYSSELNFLKSAQLPNKNYPRTNRARNEVIVVPQTYQQTFNNLPFHKKSPSMSPVVLRGNNHYADYRQGSKLLSDMSLSPYRKQPGPVSSFRDEGYADDRFWKTAKQIMHSNESAHIPIVYNKLKSTSNNPQTARERRLF